MKRRKPKLKPDAYNLLCQSVERGIAFGLRRAYKYHPEPDEEIFKENLHREIMLALSEDFEL